MANQLQPSEKDIFQIVRTIIQLVEGRHNATGEVTLTPGAATTVVSHPNCSRDSVPVLTATTLHAAQEVGNGTIYVSSVDQGGFTITHANNAQADRTFLYQCGGG